MEQKNRAFLVYGLPILLVVVSLGCSLTDSLSGSSGSAAGLIPTRTPLPTYTPTPPGADPFGVTIVNNTIDDPPAQQPTPLEEPPTPVPTRVVVEPTATPPPPPTDTPESDPSVTLVQNMNIRGGPGTNYPVVGGGSTGQSSKIVGRIADGTWVQVEYPAANDGKGWVFSPLVQINGDLEKVAVVTNIPAPPPPTPAPAPAPAEEVAEAPPPAPEKKYQFTPTGWHASENAAIVHFKGRMRDEGGNLVNGYSVLVDNWSWSVISHPSGASHHYPEKGDGEWDVVIPARDIGNGVGWWYLTVVRYECLDFLSRFDAQCKQFTRLSEDVKIQVNWPDETVINADWVCHWDCDKGLYVQGFRR